jgi:hypothetical protein
MQQSVKLRISQRREADCADGGQRLVPGEFAKHQIVRSFTLVALEADTAVQCLLKAPADQIMLSAGLSGRPDRIREHYRPGVDGSGLARLFFTSAALVGAAMCSAC